MILDRDMKIQTHEVKDWFNLLIKTPWLIFGVSRLAQTILESLYAKKKSTGSANEIPCISFIISCILILAYDANFVDNLLISICFIY